MNMLQEIRSGEFDESLDAIIRTAVARKRYLQEVKGAQNQSEFAPGTKVQITTGIKPKYLIGLTGKVSSEPASRRGDLMFEFDDRSYPYVNHRFSRTVGVPASLLKRI